MHTFTSRVIYVLIYLLTLFIEFKYVLKLLYMREYCIFIEMKMHY